jgi:hypothetical protein
MKKGDLKKLQRLVPSLEAGAATASPADSARLRNLAEILKHPAA